MSLLTIPEALEKYPRLRSHAQLDAPALKRMVDNELRGLSGVPSRDPDNRVMLCETSIQDFLEAYSPNSET